MSLFILFAGPNKKVKKKSTIGRWVTLAIMDAYKTASLPPTGSQRSFHNSSVYILGWKAWSFALQAGCAWKSRPVLEAVVSPWSVSSIFSSVSRPGWWLEKNWVITANAKLRDALLEKKRQTWTSQKQETVAEEVALHFLRPSEYKKEQ